MERKTLMSFLAAMSMAISFISASASTLSGVKVPPSLNLGGQTFFLRGAAVRHTGPFGIISSYVMAVYVPQGKAADRAHKLDDAETVLWLHSFHDLDKESMGAMLTNSFAMTNPKDRLTRLQHAISRFKSLIGAVKDGDNLAMIADPRKGVAVYENGAMKGSVEAPGLAPALLDIWLGPSPVSKPFKAKLLDTKRVEE